MAIELATSEYNRDAQEWRLYSPDREKTFSLPKGFRSVVEDAELTMRNAVLHTLGYRPAAALTAW